MKFYIATALLSADVHFSPKLLHFTIELLMSSFKYQTKEFSETYVSPLLCGCYVHYIGKCALTDLMHLATP